ncbi:hypothetical protein ACL6C3_12665 [Capilliphycus salinus ALCB114379]|uniref:hypothetical protein n=1 Tax=Capilliphycus salinus TaxID=2768948 RepID=UPI0039A747AA
MRVSILTVLTLAILTSESSGVYASGLKGGHPLLFAAKSNPLLLRNYSDFQSQLNSTGSIHHSNSIFLHSTKPFRR